MRLPEMRLPSAQVERLLDGIGVVVYLLDCTKLKTAEEKDIFQRLQEINPQLMKRLSERLFFVVCGTFQTCKQNAVVDLHIWGPR